MRIQSLYAALAATDLRESEAFYTALFGRGPDDRPMATLIQWRDVAGANVQIIHSPEHAGASMATIVVPDIEEARADLAARHLTLSAVQQGDYGRIAHITDPAGNRLTLAEPPRDMPPG